jgi:transposase
MGRRVFSAEFKREAVKLAKQVGVSRAKVAKELELHPNVLGRWVRLFETGKWNDSPGTPIRNEKDLEIERLKRELNRVKAERDILKKAVAYFAKEPV